MYSTFSAKNTVKRINGPDTSLPKIEELELSAATYEELERLINEERGAEFIEKITYLLRTESELRNSYDEFRR